MFSRLSQYLGSSKIINDNIWPLHNVCCIDILCALIQSTYNTYSLMVHNLGARLNYVIYVNSA